MRKARLIAALAATIGVLAATYAATAMTPASDAAAPGHAPIHGASAAAGASHRQLGGDSKAYESGKINPHLTEGECALLGGEVIDWSTCLSGRVCHTADETGYDHLVCISKS